MKKLIALVAIATIFGLIVGCQPPAEGDTTKQGDGTASSTSATPPTEPAANPEEKRADDAAPSTKGADSAEDDDNPAEDTGQGQESEKEATDN